MTGGIEYPRVTGCISAVRIRVGLFGRPVVQIRRVMYRLRSPPQPPGGEPPSFDDLHVRIGDSAWRDARRADAVDLAMFVDAMQR